VDPQGRFWHEGAFRERIGEIRLEQVWKEWHAQADLFVSLTGNAPTHFDSHHHSAYFTPELSALLAQLCQQYDCAMRLIHPPDLSASGSPYPDTFIASFFGQGATRGNLLRILTELPEGVTEIMCHPGYADEGLLAPSSYNQQREQELEVLSDPEISASITRLGINLISFRDLNKPRL
jgi:predicted glycoside hydrolase/deacetylase ChbG (UPF0249 family)